MKSKYLYLSLLLLLVITSVSCSKTSAETNNPNFIPDEKWRLWQSKTPDQAASLKTVVNYNVKRSSPIGYPTAFVVSKDTNLYLVDNKYSGVFKISSDFQTAGQFIDNKPGNSFLENPINIKEFDNNLYISDNEGLKIVKKDGTLEKNIRPYVGVIDFSHEQNGNYLVSSVYLKSEKESPLLLELDSDGKKVGSVGKEQSTQYNGLENSVFLEIAGKNLIVAYKRLPLIEIYDLENKKLLEKFDVKASIFDDLSALKSNKELINPEPGKNRLPQFIAGVKVAEDKLYVLLHLPYPEIIEYTLKGEEVRRYRSEESRNLDYFGFDIRLMNNTKQFIVGTFDVSRIPSMMVYEESK